MTKEQIKEQVKGVEQTAVSIIDLIFVVTSHLKIVIIMPVITSIIAIIYVLFFTTPVYISSAKITSSSGSGGPSSNATGLAAQFGIEIPGKQKDQKWIYPEIVKSKTLALKMLKRKFDTKKFGPQKSLFQILTIDKNKNEKDYAEAMNTANKVVDMIGLKENPKTGIITLTISSFEPQLCADFSSALIEELDEHQRTYNNKKMIEARNFIEERIKETNIELTAAEEALKIFRDRNRRIENSPSLQLEEQRYLREVSVLTGVFTTLKQQLETSKIEELKKSDYVIVIDPPEVPQYRSKPNRKMIVLLAGVFGLFFAILLAFIIEYFVRNSDERNKLHNIRLMAYKNISELIYFKK